jgi:hypothetical protein
VKAARVALAALLLAGAAAALSAQSVLDLSVSLDDLPVPAAALSAGLDLADERALGDDGAVRWNLGAGASFIPSDGSVRGTTSGALDASWSVPGWTFLGRLSGSASASTVDGIGRLAAAVGASLVNDGELAGISLEPTLSLQGLVDPFIDLDVAVRVTVLAGSAVLEPGLSAGVRWDTGTRVRMEPGLSVSWYPGIPLTIETGFRWTAGVVPDVGWTSEWTVTAAVAGALGGVLLFTGAGSGGHGTAGWYADAAAEIAFVVGEVGRAELSLPFRCSVTGSDADGITAGLGGGARLSW